MEKVKFWEEEAGHQSSTRLIFLIGSVWLMGLTTYMATKPDASALELGGFFTGVFVVLAGSKLVQKAQEAKPDLAKDPNKV